MNTPGIRTLGHKGGPCHGAGPIQLSGDGRQLAVGCSDGVYIYDLDSRQQVARLGANPVQLAFLPCGKQIATAGIGTRVATWDIARESKVVEFEATQSGRFVRSVDVSPDGKWIATGATDKTARIWNAETGDAICEFGNHEGGNVFDVAFSRDGTHLATGCFDGKARLFDIRQKKLKICFEGHSQRGGERVYSSSFSHDDQHVVTAAPDTGVMVWRGADGEIVREFKDSGDAVGALFLPGDARVISSHYAGGVKLWDVGSGACLRELQAHDGRTQNAALTPCGTTLVTTSMDGRIRVWDVATLTQIGQIDGHKSSIVDLCYTSDGRRLATAHYYGGPSIWNLGSETVTELPSYSMHAGSSVAASPNGNLLAFDSDQTVHVWNVTTMQFVAEFRRGHGERGIWWPQDVTFVDDHRVAFYSADGFDKQRHIVIWDLERRSLDRMIPLQPGVMMATASSDGAWLVVMDFGGKRGRIVHRASDASPMQFELSKEAICCCISPDKRLICFGHESHPATWLRVADVEFETPPPVHIGPARALAFSPHGDVLAVSHGDKTTLWSLAAGAEVASIDHGGLLAFHPQEHELAISVHSRIHRWKWSDSSHPR